MATVTVPWSQIEAECDGYRAGFVATFRKYEGQPTDKKDALGRVVKVTRRSFAGHFGIDPTTFSGWVKVIDNAPPTPSRQPERLAAARIRHEVRRDPVAVIEAIMSAPEGTQDKIFHELKLRRAGEDRSPANRKAAEAHVHEAMEPVRRAIATTHIDLCIQALREAAEALVEAGAENSLTEDALRRIDRAHEKFVLARHEAEFKVEAGR